MSIEKPIIALAQCVRIALQCSLGREQNTPRLSQCFIGIARQPRQVAKIHHFIIRGCHFIADGIVNEDRLVVVAPRRGEERNLGHASGRCLVCVPA